MSLSVRGNDQNQRERRGPPSQKTLELRSAKQQESNKKAARHGYETLFPSQQTSQSASNIQQNVFASAADTIQNNIGEIPIPPSIQKSSSSTSFIPERIDIPQHHEITADFMEDDGEYPICEDGIMQKYLVAVQNHLQEEIANLKPHKLLDILKKNDWWLRSIHSSDICAILGTPKLSEEPSYIRDIFVSL
jgi:hypothetical protein